MLTTLLVVEYPPRSNFSLHGAEIITPPTFSPTLAKTAMPAKTESNKNLQVFVKDSLKFLRRGLVAINVSLLSIISFNPFLPEKRKKI